MEIGAEPWFSGADVLHILYGKAQGMGHQYDKLEADEKQQVKLVHLSYRNRPAWIVSESGLYKLIMRSDKPEAREFQNWVTRQTIPLPAEFLAFFQKQTELLEKLVASVEALGETGLTPGRRCQTDG